MSLTVNCPTCDKAVVWTSENEFRPFCSERCKLIDLGQWADESYAIPVKGEFDIDNLDELGYDEGDFFQSSEKDN